MEGVDIPTEAIERCVDIIDDDGDINYLGRGCNQIFAWGPIMYLFNSNSVFQALDRVCKYFKDHFPVALQNYNLIMADVPGRNRIWWWDYHYSTVYFGHVAFWLMLSCLDAPRDIGIRTIENALNGESGVQIFREGHNYCCIFKGRNHYLAEKGSIVCNLAIEGVGTIFKGPLGPCGKLFGSKYSRPAHTIINYLGPIKERLYFGKQVLLENVFPKTLACKVRDEGMELTYDLGRKVKYLRFSMPVMSTSDRLEINLYVDDEAIEFAYVGSYAGPYGKTDRYESDLFAGRILKLCLARRNEA
jgi:hypothetical protein